MCPLIDCTFIIQVHTSNIAAANLEHSQQAEVSHYKGCGLLIYLT